MPQEEHVPQRGSYTGAMLRAIAFTRELGYTTRNGFEPGLGLITPELSEIVREWTRLNVSSRHDDHIAGRCIQITCQFVNFLHSAGIDAVFTLGWMSYRDHAVYRFGEAEIRHWLVHGIPNPRNLNVHAWTTLDSGEIIDPSWLSTVGIVRGKRDLIGAVIIAGPDQTTAHQYHPVTVDIDVMSQLGLLASDGTTHTPRDGFLTSELSPWN